MVPGEKVWHFKWIAGIIAKRCVKVDWVTGGTPITKGSLNFTAVFWWSIVCHRLALIANDNTLKLDHTALITCIMSGYALSLARHITKEILKRALKYSTSIPFPCMIYRLCNRVVVSIFVEIDHFIEVTLV